MSNRIFAGIDEPSRMNEEQRSRHIFLKLKYFFKHDYNYFLEMSYILNKGKAAATLKAVKNR
jgi:hypothetical protein